VGILFLFNFFSPILQTSSPIPPFPSSSDIEGEAWLPGPPFSRIPVSPHMGSKHQMIDVFVPPFFFRFWLSAPSVISRNPMIVSPFFFPRKEAENVAATFP